MAEEQFYDHLPSLELGREAAKASFVGIRGGTESELGTKFLSETPLQTDDRLLADLVLLWQKAVGEAQFILGEALHPDKKAALTTLSPRPFFDVFVNRFPAAEIEIANAKIRPTRHQQCLLKRGQ
jgi:hypothetical protein